MMFKAENEQSIGSHNGSELTHWGRVTHMWVNIITIVGSDNVCRLVGAKPSSEPMLQYY